MLGLCQPAIPFESPDITGILKGKPAVLQHQAAANWVKLPSEVFSRRGIGPIPLNGGPTGQERDPFASGGRRAFLPIVIASLGGRLKRFDPFGEAGLVRGKSLQTPQVLNGLLGSAGLFLEQREAAENLAQDE